mmetsp:Transcript_16011/g.18002  ORF Transcript_16011/g.18002 Transcript_16011/m.18002 type:complete len:1714 (-) Transcript_16011:385-5526(-)
MSDNINDNLTSPVASRAIIHGSSIATVTTPEAAASLLPETAVTTTTSISNTKAAIKLSPLPHIASNAAPRTPNVIRDHIIQQQPSPIPPVAPAVLLLQREGSSNSATNRHSNGTTATLYSYPVATFVTNLVRSVSENVRAEIRDHILPTNCSNYPQIPPTHPQHPESSAQCTIDATATSTTASQPDTNNNDNNNSNTSDGTDAATVPTDPAIQLSRMAASNFEDGSQVWSLIDGELVARLDENEDYEDEGNDVQDDDDNTRSIGDISLDECDFMQQHDHHNSKSSRMQKGVRKMKKWKNILGGGGRGDGQKRRNGRNKKAKRVGGPKQREEEYSIHDDTNKPRNTHDNHAINDDGGRDRELHNTVSDDDVDYISAAATQYSRQSPSRSQQTTTTNNNDDINSTIANNNKSQSEELTTLTGSMKSTTSIQSSNTINNKVLKKKKHRFPGWLVRGGAANSSTRSIRSNLSTNSSSSQSSIRKKRQKQAPSSSTTTAKIDPSLMGASTVTDKDTATVTDPIRGASMPPLTENSMEFSSNSNHKPSQQPLSSLIAQSPLHAPPTVASLNGGLLAAPSVPPNVPYPHSFQQTTSIAAQASFVCHADSLTVEAGVLPDSMIAATEYYIEDRLDDYDKYDAKEDKCYDPLLKNMARDSDFKVDKQEAPSIDSWLRQAGEFAKDLLLQDDDMPLTVPSPPIKSAIRKLKSDGESIPLSMARPGDKIVHNDILKIVLVGDNAVDKSGLGLLLRKSTKKSRKRKELGVDVHTWMPPNTDNVKFTLWEVQASKSEDPLRPNFGARPGTQSLFFSDRSLYLLVWDMGANNSKTFRPSTSGMGFESEDEDDSDDEGKEEYMNAYHREEADRKADRALQTDIQERVLSWVDCVARRGPHSAILPIALVPSNMSPDEAKRRCHVMQTLIMEHTERKFPANIVPPKVLCGPETVICVSLETNMGLDYLERMVLEIADPSHNVFDHVGRPVPPGTVEVMECCRRLKANSHKLILVDHLMAELPANVELSVEVVMHALQFLSSIGQLLYFGGSDSMLRHYVILNRRWLVSALSCILRNDLERELSETRRFMNIQSLYSNQRFQESHVTNVFSVNNSSCPILSSEDTQMLWQSMTFMREAADRSSQLSENSQTVSSMFGFLEHLLVHTGVFLPLEIDRFSSTDSVYFVPSLLSQESAKDIWTYKSSESWMTTLCHSWLFQDGAPVGLMEKVTVALIRDLYESSHAVAGKPSRQNMNGNSHPQSNPHHLQRAQTFPFGRSSLTDYLGSYDGEPIGLIKIHQIVCWKNSLLIKIGRVFPEANEIREAFIEIFVAVTDQASPHSVASDAMQSNMQRLVVSGKGQDGLHGHKLWKGGYNIVLDSIKASVANSTNVERQVVCPQCLAHEFARSASTWSWDSVRAASDPFVRCMRGHKVDRNMICGTVPVTVKSEDGSKMGNVHKKQVKDLLPSIVVVGLWDDEFKVIRQVGSGFVASRKHGLIVTAGHTLFSMDPGRDFGKPLFGMKDARVRAVIGLIPCNRENDNAAVFRYFAEIVEKDIHNMDACILKITAKLENDVADAALIGEQPEKLIHNFQDESLPCMKITSRYELEQSVRIIGFNQGGEGMLEKGKHVNRSADVVQGYICKQFIPSDDHSSSSGDSSSSEGVFAPREEIVINNCPTIDGHSGGPCVNDEGKVIGILSRADPVDRGRCYLVPSSEIRILINKTKKRGNIRY